MRKQALAIAALLLLSLLAPTAGAWAQDPEPAQSVRLQDEEFLVDVEWRNHRDGSRGRGFARKLSEESAVFWFFDESNVELTVKILDGRPINAHWWVFLASMTDLEVKVTVLQNRNSCLSLPVFPPDCPTKVYEQVAGTNQNFLDTQAFPAEVFPADPADASAAENAEAPQPGLRLHQTGTDWRVSVMVDWKLPSGETGQGFGVPLTDQSGYLWFFDPSNIELTVKVLDGRAVNGHWWVFLASMTNVETTVRVTQCPPEGPIGAPCSERVYHTPQDTNRNFLDTAAF